MEQLKFPFDYGSISLLEEIKYNALRQKLNRIQKADITKEDIDEYNLLSGQNVTKETVDHVEMALDLSRRMELIYIEATIKRDAYYTHCSLEKHFGTAGLLAKTGAFGRFIAYLLNHIK